MSLASQFPSVCLFARQVVRPCLAMYWPIFCREMQVLRPKLLIAETNGFTPHVIQSLRDWADVDLGPLAQGAIGRALGEYDIVWTRLGHRLQADDIPVNCRCRILGIAATGLDHIDIEACDRAGIHIASLRGEVEFLRNVRATAEHTIALALSLIRRLPAAHASVLEGRWDRDAFRGREIFGRTAGVIGMGRLGSIVASYFRAFGMAVIGYDPRPDYPVGIADRCSSLEDLFSNADLITVHVAYKPSTRHLISSHLLALVRPGAVLINTSRGGIVDQTALLAALADRKLSGAALDVIDGEPNVGRAHPLVRYAREHENLIITPHIGGNTIDSLAKSEAFIANKVRRMWENSCGN